MKKLLLAWVLLVMLTSVSAQTTFFFSNGINYKTTSVSTVEVTASGPYYTVYTGSITLPKTVMYSDVTYTVTSIENDAFNGCRGLTSISIPRSVTSIGKGAFLGCSSLTSITIPSSVTTIGDGAFCACKAVKKYTVHPSNPTYSTLDDVLFNKDRTTLIAYPNRESSQYVIPPSVTSIGVIAFGFCSSLTSITIPTSVTSIGIQAFDGCTELSEIHCQKEVPLPIMSYTFNSVGKATCKLYVPKGSSASYSKAPYWKEFQTIIEEDSRAL